MLVALDQYMGQVKMTLGRTIKEQLSTASSQEALHSSHTFIGHEGYADSYCTRVHKQIPCLVALCSTLFHINQFEYIWCSVLMGFT